jgi:hypothetical protein
MAEKPLERLNRYLFILENPDEGRWTLEATGTLANISDGVLGGHWNERDNAAEFERLRAILRELRGWVITDSVRLRALVNYREVADYPRSHWWWWIEEI